MPSTPIKITPEILLNAYASGVFPMADSASSSEIYWVDPNHRAIFPLDKFHVSKSLARLIKQQLYQIKINTQFTNVLTACADRPETWINSEIHQLYTQLYEMGFAHSIEVYDKAAKLVGGVYGVSLGGAFFGESMFSTKSNTSKIALTYLVARLKYGGFSLFDVQFLTQHLQSLGAIEINKDIYREKLSNAINIQADFFRLNENAQPSEVLHLSNHTS